MLPARVLLWCTVLASLGLLARYFWGDPLPGWVALVGIGWVLSVYGVGLWEPRWEMFGEVLFEAPEGEHGLGLLLDGATHLDQVERVLDLLGTWSARATFLFTKDQAEREPVLVGLVQERGHDVGLTWTGHRFSLLFTSRRQVQRRLEQGLAALRRQGAEPVVMYPGKRCLGPPLFLAASRVKLVVALPSKRTTDSLLRDGAVVRLALGERGITTLAQWLDELGRRELRCVALRSWR